ncbi:MAG TPA: hypothetical protein VGX70_02150 [Gemmataceae bacterium]|nr:hypothetical protein [Gemmataceae bacterium]
MGIVKCCRRWTLCQVATTRQHFELARLCAQAASQLGFEQLLSSIQTIHSPDQLRALRAIEVLEHIRSPEAREILQSLAKGPQAARLTREAQDSLDRLTWKPVAQR